MFITHFRSICAISGKVNFSLFIEVLVCGCITFLMKNDLLTYTTDDNYFKFCDREYSNRRLQSPNESINDRIWLNRSRSLRGLTLCTCFTGSL